MSPWCPRIGPGQAFNPEFDGEIEFGISLHPDQWSKGYALEALTPVLDHGLNTLPDLQRILGVADAPNHASRKLQERAGFRLIREMVWSGYPVVVNVFENT